LGEVADSTIFVNEMGTLVEETWCDLPARFPLVLIDQFVIMPNHLHGIIRIIEEIQNENATKVGGLMNQTPTPNLIPDEWIMMKNPATTLGKIVRYFKAKSALKIRNKMNISFYWQRNYYEHIINGENELSRIRKYINLNPANWLMDEDNPVNGKTS
jgi:putative transposase